MLCHAWVAFTIYVHSNMQQQYIWVVLSNVLKIYTSAIKHTVMYNNLDY